MASLHRNRTSPHFSIRFRYQGRNVNRSLGTGDQRKANGLCARIEETLQLLARGRQWHSNATLRSLRDLGDAEFSFYVNPYPYRTTEGELSEAIGSLTPISVDLKFDHFPFKLKEFHPGRRKFGKRSIWFSQLPSLDKIEKKYRDL
jgi:hypothetical protein